jgi:hypothetical protein
MKKIVNLVVEGLQFIHIHVPHRRIVNRAVYTFNFMDYYTTAGGGEEISELT